ncbi:MAG: ribonuclease HII [Candidatus Heimdallarchaeota archaeon]|nr:ribonuclease HII [Candidatus Heimdallarchaeota archaeon]
MLDKIMVGADEAGRGLIIGPMVIGACAITEHQAENFEHYGIKDSKKYTSYSKLKDHMNFIKKNSLAWSVKVLSAKIIDHFNINGMSMDEAEAFAFYRALEELAIKIPEITVFHVDNFQAADKLQTLMKQHEKLKTIKLIVKPRAESEFISVSAGSILARERSLLELEKMREKYGDFGSGSTSDAKTIAWLKRYYKNHGKWPPVVRTFWKTTTEIEEEIKKMK